MAHHSHKAKKAEPKTVYVGAANSRSNTDGYAYVKVIDAVGAN